MNMVHDNRDTHFENFAAELTGVVYPIALRQGMSRSWISTELALWRSLAGTVKKWAGEWSSADASDDLKSWRERLVAELTRGAFHVALSHGMKGSHLAMEWNLYPAFRSVIEGKVGACRYDATPNSAAGQAG